MIKSETVCICDGCGARAKAKAAGTWRNETTWVKPDGWSNGKYNDGVHFCPACTKRLSEEGVSDD